MSDLVFVEQKPMAGKEHPIQPGATIGREGCDIVLADPEISRRHATMRRLDNGVAVEDFGSTNGTYVNGDRVSGVRELKEGDEVRFGNTVWRLETVGGATQAAPPAAVASPAVTQAPPPQQAQAPPPPPPPAPVAAAAPAGAAQSGPAPSGRRGDVALPAIDAPSAVRRVLPAVAPGQAPAFAAPSTPKARGTYGTVATRTEWTIVCLAIVAVTLVLLIIFFAV